MLDEPALGGDRDRVIARIFGDDGGFREVFHPERQQHGVLGSRCLSEKSQAERAKRGGMTVQNAFSIDELWNPVNGIRLPHEGDFMKKLKHEAELFKAALVAGVQYAEGRGAVEFEATDSASDKALYVYRLLVHDKIIAPMPEEQVAERTVRHRLATWYAHQLPKGHPLLG